MALSENYNFQLKNVVVIKSRKPVNQLQNGDFFFKPAHTYQTF